MIYSLSRGITRLCLPGFALLAVIFPLMAEESKIVTQAAIVAPSQVAGASKPPVEAQNPVPNESRNKLVAKGPAPVWIWGADDNKRYYLRKEFTGGSKSAILRATCDNVMAISINGKEIARSSNWEEPVEKNIQQYILPGKNVIVAEVSNEGGPAGFIFKMMMTSADGKSNYVVSDTTWQASEDREGKNAVPTRKIAEMNEGPWKSVFSGDTVATNLNGNVPSNVFVTLPGFQVERIFEVPRSTMGSWVSLTTDDKGRLIASDQEGKGLYRITPPRIGSSEETRVEKLNVKMSGAQGLLWANGALYVMANGGPGSGLYRLRSTKGDDQFDEMIKLKAINGGGEHGPHALRLAPDGKSIYVVSGNHTHPPDNFNSSRIPKNWNEDHLLPRQWDANGHATGILAPGGWIARTDFDGKTWEMISIGYRNTYDFAFNADGEIFAYDADMEWDMGMPWYRPTRVVHTTSGSEFGWRSGTGKWPSYYVDSLPQMIDIGPGSPVGVEFGYGTRFPAKYQKALYCLDWTFGTIYALHIEPEGSTYKCTKEEFLSRTPLPLTDVTVGKDGALYFTVGGRGAQSELFRVTYVGKDSTEKVDYQDRRGEDLRALRHSLENLQGAPAAEPEKALELIWPNLNHSDRFIRYAARVALEFQPVKLWKEKLLKEADPVRLIQGAVAMARQGDKALETDLLRALDGIDFTSLTETQQQDLLRAYSLVFIRMGEPSKETASSLGKRLESFFPARSDQLNRELCNLLIYLQDPQVAGKTIALLQEVSKPVSDAAVKELLARNRGYGDGIAKMLANAPDLQKLYYLFVLRNLKVGWTPEMKKLYFTFLNQMRQKSGGASFQGFLNNMEKDAFNNTTDTERVLIEAAGLRKPYQVKELPKPVGPGKDWKLEELVEYAEPRLKGRDFKNGQKMFAAARCVVCHRFNAEGGATGPDLTQVAGRFSLKDLCESIILPSKVIADQYKSLLVTTTSGKPYNARILADNKDRLTLLIDPEDSTKVIELKKSDIEEMKPSPISLMPEGLLKQLNENETLDLLAYMLSRGDPNHPMFRK